MSNRTPQDTPSRSAFPIPSQWSELLGRDHDGWLACDDRRYRVKAFVDSGTFGSIFEIEPEVSPGSSLAVKLFHRNHRSFLNNPANLEYSLSRFHREYQLQSRYQFDCVPRYHGHGSTRFEEHGSESIEFPYFLTDLLSGDNLHELVESNRLAGSTLDAIRFGRRLAQAVRLLHEKVVHRDLAAKNVWLTQAGSVLVLDLGCATDPDHSGTLTRVDEIMGTAPIVAPSIWREHARGDKIHFTVQTDLYAVACLTLLYWQGKYPYEDDSAVYWRPHQSVPVLRERVQKMNGFEPVWDLLSKRILAADPEDPIRTTEELDRELAAIEDQRNYIRLEHRVQSIAPLIESPTDPDRYRNICYGIRMLFTGRDAGSQVTDREIIAGSTAVYKIGHLSRLALEDLEEKLNTWLGDNLRDHGSTDTKEGEANALIPLNALLTRFEAMTDLLRHCYDKFPKLHTRMDRVRAHLDTSAKTVQKILNRHDLSLVDRRFLAIAEANHMISEVKTNLVQIKERLEPWGSALRQTTEYRPPS